METAEHYYTDDPAQGPPDVRTRIPDTDYFFLGNGLILAAVQLCRSGTATPVGLLLMDPERFGPKRAALTCHPETGLAGTMLRIQVGEEVHTPTPEALSAEWTEVDGVPGVEVRWETPGVDVREIFTCSHPGQRVIERRIGIRVPPQVQEPAILRVGSDGDPIPVSPHGDREGTATMIHELRPEGDGWVAAHFWDQRAGLTGPEAPGAEPPGGAPASVTRNPCWLSLARVRTSDPALDHLFASARNHLPVSVDHGGRMDGSIWQYNLEWVRDQSHVAEALVRLGDPEKARVILTRLLASFVSPEGDTVDSGRRRPAAEVELDQNGTLLSALAVYLDWTGDRTLLEEQWDRIRALADFPFQDRFRHPASGLLHNSREYWERHEGHGIRDGFELMSQFAVAMGVEAASRFAGALGQDEDGRRWARRAAALKRAMLEDTVYRLVEDGRFIKRRGTDGEWQEAITLPPDSDLPRGTPLGGEGIHVLDPDTSSTLPIAHGFIPPEGELARNTLAQVEALWNQLWDGGGYGRYNATSEPDSPGAWPFASLFVARAYTEAGDDEKVWRILRWLKETQGGLSGAWFENDGPRISPPYPQVGITPWTWAEIITLFVHHFLGFRPDGEGILIRPRLLEGLEEMEATLRVRGHGVRIRVRRGEGGRSRMEPMEAGSILESPSPTRQDGGFRIPFPTSDISLDLFI